MPLGFKSIDDMIDKHIIQSDLPDKQSETELFEKVVKHQIHTSSLHWDNKSENCA